MPSRPEYIQQKLDAERERLAEMSKHFLSAPRLRELRKIAANEKRARELDAEIAAKGGSTTECHWLYFERRLIGDWEGAKAQLEAHGRAESDVRLIEKKIRELEKELRAALTQIES